MKKILFLSALIVMATSFAQAKEENHPCKPKREAKHQARKALHECIESWAKDRDPKESDPGDDCSSKMSAFVAAAKDVKACFAEHAKK